MNINKLKQHIYDYGDLYLFFIISIILFYSFWEINIKNILALILWAGGLITRILGLMKLGDGFTYKTTPKKLVTEGIYSKISNPIYYGCIICYVGLTI